MSGSILAIVKEPGHAACVEIIPSTRPVRDETLMERRLTRMPTSTQLAQGVECDIVLLSRNATAADEENLRVPFEVRGPIAIVRAGADPDGYNALPAEQIYAWLQWTMLTDARINADASYHGVADGIGFEVVYVEDGARARRPLRHYRKHSRYGFSWGFDGGGPADLARAMLIDTLALEPHPGDDAFPEIDEELEVAFMSQFLVNCPGHKAFSLSRKHVLAWLSEYPPRPTCDLHHRPRRRADGFCPDCVGEPEYVRQGRSAVPK